MLKYTVVVLFVQLLRVECLYDGDSCNAAGRPGTCRPLSRCQSIVTEIRLAGSPMPLQLRKKLQALNCGFEGKEPMVCCSISSNEGTVSTNNPFVLNGGGTASVNSTYNFGSEVNIDGNDGSRDIQNHPNLSLLPTKCGTIERDKIAGGESTSLFEMPWMVLLSYHTGDNSTFSCGGTLITERYILTAAHCVSYLGKALRLDGVILGEYDIRTDPDCMKIGGEETCAPRCWNASIEQTIPHPGYTRMTMFDDIALVRLAKPADFRLDSMKPICLPLSEALRSESLVGKDGVVAGWGVTTENIEPSVLLNVDLPIISTKDCNDAYKGAHLISDKDFCTEEVLDKDSCGGDSGGPLMYPGLLGGQGPQYVQRGVFSFGPKRCGIGGYPTVYTNVAYYMEWILDHIRA